MIFLNERANSISLKIADRLGREAFLKGKPNAPVLNKELMKIIEDELEGKDKVERKKIMMDLMKAYLNAWMEEQMEKANAEISKMNIF